MSITVAIDANDPLLSTSFAEEMVRQMRALDTYDMYEKWPIERILDPYIMTKERRQEIPVIGDPDEVTMARVKAYYNALAGLIEKECSLMAVPMINLSHEGFGRAIITVGKLVVVDKVLRDVHRFGFKSFENMHEEASKIISKGAALVEAHREVAQL